MSENYISINERLERENEILRAGVKGDFDLDAWLEFAKEKTQLLERIKVLEEARSALNLLCYLKRHKDDHGKDAMYLREQPKAWEKAEKALECY